MAGYHYFLIVHLSGFALFTGALVSDIIIHNQLWSNRQTDATLSKTLLSTTTKLSRLMGVSLGITLLAGIVMMSKMHLVYGPQSWIRIKISLVVILLILRVLNSRNNKRLKEKILVNPVLPHASLKYRITGFQWLQLLLVAGIIILSVKKFN
ncbi:hypothetical protein [Pseudobacter ginsenosidimutans]|uniref:Uncharacterized protein n=1 Tax=Pseudobacter ginsenosidimutans TaxID=661488 RepID=A0A4Q7N487_9BACT|nr:hypothetical protein [Pseudobacter ginsenosidimutans]QEC44337.1 hypothetical protein FSB84_22655 [Pseudobacter ginsenosidimutans]RZS75801.1 hypothetical protein EV199_1676 [Pseudobacter ginsenosidimutans]